MIYNHRTSWAFALHFLTKEQQEKMWEYIVLTDYGTRYIPPERQGSLLTLLHQLVEQEHLNTLDLLPRLEQLSVIKERVLSEGGPFLELFTS